MICRRFLGVADRLEPQLVCEACAWYWLTSTLSCRVVPGQDLQAALDERFGSDRTCQEYRDVAMAITDTTCWVGLLFTSVVVGAAKSFAGHVRRQG